LGRRYNFHEYGIGGESGRFSEEGRPMAKGILDVFFFIFVSTVTYETLANKIYEIAGGANLK
jgi:hypothetical protein